MTESARADMGKSAPARSVELLYFDGCPHHEQMLARLDGLLARVGIRARVQVRSIQDEDDAVRHRFLGSPTVRVDGYDVEPGAEERRDYGMFCRLYLTGHGVRETPPDEWILDALTVERGG